MNFEYFLYQYLLKHHKAEVPYFGVFELTKKSASIDAENSIITPPKEVVVFQYVPGLVDDQLVRYISDQTNSDLSTVKSNLKNEVEQWFQKLQTPDGLTLENIGQFQLDHDHKVVKITDDHHDVFGLEAINLQALKKKSQKKYSDSEHYTFNKSVIWTFSAIVIIGTIVLFFLRYQPLLFGKSSRIPTKKESTKRSEPKRVLTIPKQDSIKTDSIKPTTNAKIQKINR